MEKKIFVPPPAIDIELLGDHPDAFKRILIMENDPEQKKVLESFLNSHHFEAIFAESALQALHEIKDNDFDLVICNMTDSVFAGEMFYKAVQRVKPQLCRRFIFLSSRNLNAASDAFIRQVNGIKLWKPFEPHVLIETIQLVLRKASGPARSTRLPVSTNVALSSAPVASASGGYCPIREILGLTCLAFTSARKSIHFATTHFSPDETLINTLIQSAQCGVQVEILVPTKTEKQVRNMIPEAVQQRLLDAGIRLLEGPITMETSRLIVIDEQWVCANQSDSSHENVNVYTGVVARTLSEVYQKYKAASQPITQVKEEPVVHRSPARLNPITGWNNLFALVASRLKWRLASS